MLSLNIIMYLFFLKVMLNIRIPIAPMNPIDVNIPIKISATLEDFTVSVILLEPSLGILLPVIYKQVHNIYLYLTISFLLENDKHTEG